MARPRQVSDADILVAATAVFLEEGPASSVSSIAERVGLSQAALFKRFGSKEDLMVAALAPPDRPPFLDDLERGPDHRPIPDQLAELAAGIQRFLQDLVPKVWCLKSAGVDMNRLMASYPVPPPLLALQGLTAWFQRAIDAGRVRDADPMSLSFILMGSLHSRAMLQKTVGVSWDPSHDDRHVRHVVDTLWRGLRTEETP